MSLVRHGGAAGAAVIGRTLFDYADELAVEVPTSCRRAGRCHECVVEVSAGLEALGPRAAAESFLRGPWRLACQAALVRDDVEIAFAPLRRRTRIVTLGGARGVREHAPAATRRGDGVWRGGERIDDYRGRILGAAIDLGTTTVVLDLVDLETGESVETVAFENPQRFGGSDVMTRISYEAEAGRGALQGAAIAAINREIRALARRRRFARRAIYEFVVAANSTMRDVLFGYDVQSIGQRPYKSTVEAEWRAGARAGTALHADAWALGLRANRRAAAYGLPLIASHVGADAAACLLAIDIENRGGETVMLVDMGTNTEVVAASGDRIVAASCPAGPAFEGGLVEFGMPAADGAIESVTLESSGESAGGAFSFRVIGGGPPEGMCGSGLIDLLAELRRHGVMTAKGVFAADRRRFAIPVAAERGIRFSKEDASNLGQAKAANYCGQYIVLRELGVDPADVDRLFLAGGFATYVDAPNAAAIGLLAPVPPERVVKAGNAAIAGARIALLSEPARRRLERLVETVEHVELETAPDFFDLFVDGCQFKPMPERVAAPAAGRERAARRRTA